MKKVQFFMLASATLLLASCGKHSDGTSVWAGGLAILPWLTGIGSIVCFVIAYLSSKSNSTTQTGLGGKNPTTIDNTGNVPIHKIGWFWFGVILAVATIVIIIMVNADK